MTFDNFQFRNLFWNGHLVWFPSDKTGLEKKWVSPQTHRNFKFEGNWANGRSVPPALRALWLRPWGPWASSASCQLCYCGQFAKFGQVICFFFFFLNSSKMGIVISNSFLLLYDLKQNKLHKGLSAWHIALGK